MKNIYIAILLILTVGILGGCKTDTMYARTVNEPGNKSWCVVGNMMSSWAENRKKIVTVNDDRMYLDFKFDHVDTQWFNRLDVTPVIMDENCIITSANKITYVKKQSETDTINVKFDVPYIANNYMTYVWQLR